MIHLSRWKVILLALSVVFGLLFAAPNMLSQAQRDALPGWLPKSVLNLGLDLQGGSYLLLEVDVPAMRDKRLTNLAEDARTVLAEASVGVSTISRQSDGVIITLADPSQMQQAQTAMRALVVNSPSGADRQVQRQGSDRIRYAFTEATMNSMAADAVTQSIEVVRRRLDSSGTKEISITRQGADRIVVQAPGQSDPAELERLIGQTAQLTFQMVDVENSIQEALNGSVPPDSELLMDEAGNPYLVKRRILVSGENLTKAEVTQDQNQRTAIGFRFDGAGAKRFGEATAANIGKPFAIILDGKVISAPNGSRAPSPNGSGIIQGNGISIAGGLGDGQPAERRRPSGPAEGRGTPHRHRRTGRGRRVGGRPVSTAIGFGIIVLFMLGAYGGLFGGISVIGLVLNGLLIVACHEPCRGRADPARHRWPDADLRGGGRRQRADL
jgi:preprotein translocase subunit SecD